MLDRRDVIARQREEDVTLRRRAREPARVAVGDDDGLVEQRIRHGERVPLGDEPDRALMGRRGGHHAGVDGRVEQGVEVAERLRARLVDGVHEPAEGGPDRHVGARTVAEQDRQAGVDALEAAPIQLGRSLRVTLADAVQDLRHAQPLQTGADRLEALYVPDGAAMPGEAPRERRDLARQHGPAAIRATAAIDDAARRERRPVVDELGTALARPALDDDLDPRVPAEVFAQGLVEHVLEGLRDQAEDDDPFLGHPLMHRQINVRS